MVYLTCVSMRKALCLLGMRAPSLLEKMSDGMPINADIASRNAPFDMVAGDQRRERAMLSRCR